MRKRVALLVAIGGLAGCSVGQDLPAANAEIGAFHRQLNAQNLPAMYAAASPELRSAWKYDDFAQLLSAVHRKLGNFQSGSTRVWNDNVNTSGHFITLAYIAKFERGAADESFVYRIDGAKVALAGYHISSNALIVN